MTEKYYSLRELLDMIDEPNSSRCEQIYLDNKEMFDKAKGSKVKHQAWSGGYYSHLRDAMNIGI
ncbi:hypothetical protein KY321_01465, partial [Candidatus Woesearchaeota archaeon]|nr:hypothetical protein [Candidatus Woesearchaeota archaeon]